MAFSQPKSFFTNPNNINKKNGEDINDTSKAVYVPDYSPVEDMKNIANAKSNNTDATQWYTNLRNNGYGTLADNLYNGNYTDVVGMLSKYGVDMPNVGASSVPNGNVNEYLNSLTGNAQTPSANTSMPYQSAYDAIAGTNTPMDIVNNFKSISGNANQALAENAINTSLANPVSPTVNGLVNQYQNTKDMTNGMWNTLFNDGRNYASQAFNYDITKMPEYNALLEAYGVRGANAANSALADGAASNGGNIDSYALANANAQNLAYKEAAINAAINAMNAKNANALGWYTQNSGNVNNMDQNNVASLGEIQQMYDTDAKERQNAVDNATLLRQQELDNDLKQLLGTLDSDTQNRATGASLVSNLAGYDTDRYKTDVNADTSKYVADKDSETSKYVSDNSLAGTKYASDNQLAGTKYSADMSLAEAQYKYNYDLLKSQYDAQIDALKANATTQGDEDEANQKKKVYDLAFEAADQIKSGKMTVQDAYGALVSAYPESQKDIYNILNSVGTLGAKSYYANNGITNANTFSIDDFLSQYGSDQ